MAASVWMKFSKVLMPRPVRPSAETMPLGHGLADAERVADGEHHVADAQRVGGAEGDRRQVLGVDAQHREVGLGIVADHLGEQLLAVVQRDLDLVGGLDHVVVGEHVAARR